MRMVEIFILTKKGDMTRKVVLFAIFAEGAWSFLRVCWLEIEYEIDSLKCGRETS